MPRVFLEQYFGRDEARSRETCSRSSVGIRCVIYYRRMVVEKKKGRTREEAINHMTGADPGYRSCSAAG